jgi:hypothetical protein
MVYYFSHLEEEVQKIYQKLDIRQPVDIDMLEIARYFDIWIDYWPGESRHINIRGLRTIFLQEGQSYEESWTTFAHELRHTLKHVGDQNRMHYLFREYQEFDANRFMYHFCIPSFMLLKVEPLSTFRETVIHIANLFKVDYAFAAKRYATFLNKKKAYIKAYC